MKMWQLVAREQIRDTLARYNWSGDAGALDDLAETFCSDGALEIRGLEPLRGRSAIAAFLRGITGKIGVAVDVNPLSDITLRTYCSPNSRPGRRKSSRTSP